MLILNFSFAEVYTIDGNAFGRPCYFPFKYENKWYSDCTKDGSQSQRLWCSVESDFNDKELWGYCPTPDSKFPFPSVQRDAIFIEYINNAVFTVEKMLLIFMGSYVFTDNFWSKNPLTNVYYQLNDKSALTWHQARKSCQQQGAELLSVSEPHEHTFVSGTVQIHFVWAGCTRWRHLV